MKVNHLKINVYFICRKKEGKKNSGRNKRPSTAHLITGDDGSKLVLLLDFSISLFFQLYKNSRQHLKAGPLCSIHAKTEKTANSFVKHLHQSQKKKKSYFFLSENQNQNSRGSSPRFLQRPSSPSLSSADLAQPVVRLGVGYDGLNGDDGLVDLRLQLPQLLDVQQAQDLRRFVQSGV